MASVKVIISLVVCTIFYAEAALIKPRIVGGSDTESDQFPYMVGLFKPTSIFQWFIGGGVILSDRLILTSAGAVKDYVEDPEKLSAVLGSPIFADHAAYVISIAEITTHPDFDEEHLLNDLAMLRAAEKIQFSEAVYPVAFPSHDSTNVNGLTAVITGWGYVNAPHKFLDMELADKLQYQITEVLRYDDCVAEYVLNHPKLDDWLTVGPKLRDSNKFCTSSPRGEGICIGDNGSPLVSSGVLIGIASWSSYCADGLPDVYTNVYAHSAWISGEMNK